MTITPQPASGDWTGRKRYDWAAIELGAWQRWLDQPKNITDEEARRACDRVRLAGLDHARRKGLTMHSRTKDHGRVLELIFTRS